MARRKRAKDFPATADVVALIHSFLNLRPSILSLMFVCVMSYLTAFVLPLDHHCTFPCVYIPPPLFFSFSLHLI
jgi:hypothetical protein